MLSNGLDVVIHKLFLFYNASNAYNGGFYGLRNSN